MEDSGNRPLGSLDRMWGLIARLDRGEDLDKQERRDLRRMVRRWRTILRRLRNKEALARLQIKIHRHGL